MNYLLIVAVLLCGCSSKGPLPVTWHSWEDPPRQGEVFLLTSGPLAFEKDFGVTCILQKFGENNYRPPHHSKGWMRINKKGILQLINLGYRVIFLPNGEEDFPYLNFTDEEIHLPPNEEGTNELSN